MDPVVSPVLLKGAQAAKGPVTRFIADQTMMLRLARAVTRKAKARGIDVSARAIGTWLEREDVQQQIQDGGATQVESALEALAWRLTGPDDERQRHAEEIFALVLAAFLRLQDPKEATALSPEWNVAHTRAEGLATREAVADVGASILERFSDSDAFDERVQSLHPWRRATATNLRAAWPVVERVLHGMVARLVRMEDGFRRMDCLDTSSGPADL